MNRDCRIYIIASSQAATTKADFISSKAINPAVYIGKPKSVLINAIVRASEDINGYCRNCTNCDRCSPTFIFF